MPKLFKKLLPLAFAVLLLPTYFNWPPAYADISSCTASIQPHKVSPGSRTDFQVEVKNTDANTIVWIKVSRPPTNFTIYTAWADNWTFYTDQEKTILTGWMINSSEILDFTLTADAADTRAASVNWLVEVSDDPNGANPFSCSGNLGVEIKDTIPPEISDVTVSNVTSNSVAINWSTDEPATSQVNYGLTSSYNHSTSADPTLRLNHSVTIAGLSANTGYHFQVLSTDAVNNTGFSGDNTFITLPSTAVTTGLPPRLNLKPTEKIPPTIKISTILDKPFKESPKITGEAADNAGLFSIEYSTDGGKNWLPVDQASGLGGKNVTFEFTPKNLEDGDYLIVARVTDTSGNIGVADKTTLIIDRLPPLVGASVISIGPQIIEPQVGGAFSLLAGVDQKITVSAVGGPTSINLVAKGTDDGKESGLFSLTRSAGTGLWSGILSFKKQGTYTLTANSIDGAGNKLQRQLPRVSVSDSPRVLNKANNQPIEKAKITLYYLEPESGIWVVWDGASYGQKNPQGVDKDGSFKLLVPPGKYYLKTQARGFQTLISEIFEINKSTPLVNNLSLKKSFKLGPISLPSFSVQKISISTKMSKLPKDPKETTLVEKEVPLFALPSTVGQEVHSISLRGRPTLLSFTATWSPAAKEQLPALATLQKNKDINIVPVSTLESLEKVRVYTKIAGYDLDALVDKDGQTIERFNLQSLPTHYFVNRKGIIKRIVVGVLSKEEILDGLGGL